MADNVFKLLRKKISVPLKFETEHAGPVVELEKVWLELKVVWVVSDKSSSTSGHESPLSSFLTMFGVLCLGIELDVSRDQAANQNCLFNILEKDQVFRKKYVEFTCFVGHAELFKIFFPGS